MRVSLARSDLTEERLALGEEVGGGNLEAVADALLALLEVGARVVDFLVAHFAVDLEHAVDVLAHVQHDRLGESILGVGVDVHLDNAVGDGFADVAEVGAGAAVEDEAHVFAMLVHHGFLTVTENLGLELHGTGLVHAVYVAEGGGKHEFTQAVEGLVGEEHVLGGGVELGCVLAAVVYAVLFAADNADLDFENDADFGAFLEHLLGDLEVLSHGQRGGIQHVGVEQGAFAFGNALLGFGDERAQEAVNLVGLAVVGVQSYEYIVLLGKAMNGLRKDDGACGGVFHGGAGGELTAAQRNLDNAVGLGLGESLEGAVDNLDGGDVNGGIGVAFLLGRIKHLDVLFLSRYRHGSMLGFKFLRVLRAVRARYCSPLLPEYQAFFVVRSGKIQAIRQMPLSVNPPQNSTPRKGGVEWGQGSLGSRLFGRGGRGLVFLFVAVFAAILPTVVLALAVGGFGAIFHVLGSFGFVRVHAFALSIHV